MLSIIIFLKRIKTNYTSTEEAFECDSLSAFNFYTILFNINTLQYIVYLLHEINIKILVLGLSD